MALLDQPLLQLVVVEPGQGRAENDGAWGVDRIELRAAEGDQLISEFTGRTGGLEAPMPISKWLGRPEEFGRLVLELARSGYFKWLFQWPLHPPRRRDLDAAKVGSAIERTPTVSARPAGCRSCPAAAAGLDPAYHFDRFALARWPGAAVDHDRPRARSPYLRR
jgi:hypothetical protein